MKYKNSLIPSNGILAITSKGLLLFDTPWTNEQTEKLITLSKEVFGKEIKTAIITHAHQDKIGGIDVILENEVEVYGTKLTATLAGQQGYQKLNMIIKEDISNYKLGNLKYEVYYPGQGHSKDNITVWFPKYKILFGGCLIKSANSKNIGNTADANVNQWPKTLQNLLDRYEKAVVVIISHGESGNTDLIVNTMELLQGQ